MDLDQPIAAYHEAGHILMAHQLGAEVLESTLDSENEDYYGHTAILWRGFPTEERRLRSAQVALAGPVAETLFLGESAFDQDLRAWRADWDEAESALNELSESSGRDELRRRWLTAIVAVLEPPPRWERLCRLADALEAHRTLDRSLLEDLLP